MLAALRVFERALRTCFQQADSAEGGGVMDQIAFTNALICVVLMNQARGTVWQFFFLALAIAHNAIGAGVV